MPKRQPPPARSHAKAVGDCPPVSALRERSRALDALDRRLVQALPPPLRGVARLADLRDGRLVFLAPTPACATRLRACSEDVLAAAHELELRVRDVVVKVARVPEDAYTPPRAKPLPRSAADHLRKTAVSLSDQELKALFLNLASLADDAPGA